MWQAQGKAILATEPGIAQGRWEAPAWFFWVVGAAALLGGVGWTVTTVWRRLRRGTR